VSRSLIKLVVTLCVTAAVLAWLIQTIGWTQIAAALAQADPMLVALAAMIGLGTRCVEARQMAVVMTRAGMPISARRVFLANSLSSLYAMVLPGDLVAGAAKWTNLSAATGKRAGVLNAMVYNRLMLLLPWLLIGVAALAVHNPLDARWLPLAAAGVTTAAIALLVVAYHDRLGKQLDALTRWLACRVLPRWAHQKVDYVLDALQPFRQFPMRFHLRILCYGLLAAAVASGSFVVLARGAGVGVSIVLLLWVRALLTMVRLLPISFNGLGVREATLVAVLVPFGVSEANAFAFGVLNIVNLLCFATVGAAYQLALGMGWANWKSPTTSTHAATSAVPGEPCKLRQV
jgi:uncharacterized membrane protein YbhN (UPF0104 family)